MPFVFILDHLSDMDKKRAKGYILCFHDCENNALIGDGKKSQYYLLVVLFGYALYINMRVRK